MNPEDEDRIDLFDSWASTYDHGLPTNDYPFTGYAHVVAAVVALAQIKPEHKVLDIGAGTGNLTAKLVDLASEVWGTDFSEEMLIKARAKVPQAHFVRGDVRDSWPSELPPIFDRIVSTYVFHELDDSEKLQLLVALARNRLNPDGYLVLGDIAFPDERAQAVCRQTATNIWDDSEHYWIASRIIPRLEEAGFVVDYEQCSACGGVFVLRPKGAA